MRKKTTMTLAIDTEQLYRFEEKLDPRHLERSRIPVVLEGYGEISAIFRFMDNDRMVYKRLPLFTSVRDAADYEQMFRTYSSALEQAGLMLPRYDTRIVAVKGRPVCLYIAQERFDKELFCHVRLHCQDLNANLDMVEGVIREIDKIRAFNRLPQSSVELAIDGQLSNWVMITGKASPRYYYIDTSTPLYRIHGVECQDPELLMKSAPSFLRWIIRLFFLDDVMNRYYDQELVLTDLAANLFKEQKPELVQPVIERINSVMSPGGSRLSRHRIEAYYEEDKWIWKLFLNFRKIDRLITTRIMKRRYDFILPGHINR